MVETEGDTEESEITEQLKQAWKQNNAENITSIISAHPKLLEKFKLAEVKTRAPSRKKTGDFTYALIGSLILNPILLIILPWLEAALGQTNYLYLFSSIAVVVALGATCFTSIISIKPFRHRAPNVSLLLAWLAFIWFSVEYLAWNQFSNSPIANWLSLGPVLPITVDIALGAIMGLMPGLLALMLTRKIIGVPFADYPCHTCLISDEPYEKAVSALSKTLEQLGLEPSRQSKTETPKKSLLAIFKTFRPVSGSAMPYTLGVHCESREDGKTIIKMLCYVDRGSRISTDKHCKSIIEVISDLLTHRSSASSHQDQSHSELYNFCLSHTKFWLHTWLLSNARPMIKSVKKQKFYIVLALIVGPVTYFVWPEVITMLGPAYSLWKSQATVVAASLTVLTALYTKIIPGVKNWLRRWVNK